MSKIKQFILFPKYVYLLLIIGLLFRLIPIRFGLPLHLNIDEPALVSGVLSLKNGPNIERFDWPHLYFYISFLFYVPAYLAQLILKLPEQFQGDSIYFMVSRFMSAMFGALTILTVYRITLRAFSSKLSAGIAALILTFLPVHVYESFFAKLDGPLTFFVSIAVYWILKCSEKLNMRIYAVTGFLIGICVSIKYNAFLLALPFVISYFYALGINGKLSKSEIVSTAKSIKFPVVSGLLSFVGFIIGTPFAILDFETFWSYEPRVGVLWQFQNVGNVPPEEYAMHAYETFMVMYRDNLGIGLWLIFLLVCLLYLFFNYRSKYINILLLPVILISFYISKFDRSPAHYFLFLIPLYIPVIADFIGKIYSKINLNQWVGLILLIGILSPSLYSSIYKTYVYAQVDTRLEAYKWVKQNIDENSEYLYVAGDSLGEVGFQKNNTSKLRRIDPDQITQPLPVYIVVGYQNINYDQFKENNWNPPGISGSSERVLTDNALVKYIDNTNRSGPPILIFKITELIEAHDD